MELFLQSDPWIRIPLYAVFGCVSEVLFTGSMDLISPRFMSSWNTRTTAAATAQRPEWYAPGRDGRAVGYTFLWMFPIYALLIFLEPISLAMQDWIWPLRGLVYMFLIWGVEFITGFLIEKIVGRCPWDYSYSRFSFKGYIRWDFAPVWFVFGFLFEWIYPHFLWLTPLLRERF